MSLVYHLLRSAIYQALYWVLGDKGKGLAPALEENCTSEREGGALKSQSYS